MFDWNLKIPVEFEKGCADATREIEAGCPRLYWGTRSDRGKFMEELFESRFGVKVEHTDCFVTQELRSYRDGFNSTVKASIDLKYGVGAFDQARAEVDKFRRTWKAASCHTDTNGAD